MVLWGELVLCALAIVVAGHRLSVCGDVVAARTGLSSGWIGLGLLATVTSLPELVTGIGSITEAGAPDMAVGDALGSCVFNLTILALVDLLHRRAPAFAVASRGHAVAAAFGIVPLGLVAVALVAPTPIATARIGWVGATSIVLVATWAIALRSTFLHDGRSIEVAEGAVCVAAGSSLRRAAIEAAAAGIVVVGAGLWLPVIAEALALAHGLSDGLIGTLLVATATSLPELAVTLSALRIGALDMAFANLLGSNLFNMVVLAVDDLVHTSGPLLAAASPIHAATALSAVTMNAVVVIALLRRSRRRVLGAIGAPSLVLLAIFLTNLWILVVAEGAAEGRTAADQAFFDQRPRSSWIQ